MLNDFLRSVRLALRPVWRRPAFALTAIITLAIGIGAGTTVLSVVDSLLLRPLPYAEPGRLVAIWPGKGIANQEIAALRERSKLYEQIGGFSPGWLMTLTNVATPRQLSATRVAGNFFEMLGVAPVLGRPFGMEAERSGSGHVAVLGYDLWQTSFAGDRDIVGRSIQAGGEPFTVVAVMPKSFQGISAGADFWYPLTMDPAEQTWAGATGLAYGKLRRGVTVSQATAELAALTPVMREEFHRPPQWLQDASVKRLLDDMVGSVRSTVLVLFGAVAFLLLIAIANVASLFLVRTAERRQEIAVRSSLGASQSRIAMLLLGECFALGAIGGLLGIAAAFAGVEFVRSILPADLPRLAEIGVDGRVLAAAVIVACGAALAAGIMPSLQGVTAGMSKRIRAGRTIAGSGGRMRGMLVAAEVALALVLTVGASVMGRTLIALNGVDRGLRTDHLLTMKVPHSAPTSEADRAYWRDVLDRVRGIPGVTSAATILHLPTSGRNWMADLEVEGHSARAGEALPRAAWQAVSSTFFATAGMRVLSGRPFDNTDVAGAPLVMALNSVLAAQLFPNESAIGKRVRAGFATSQNWATVVAVVSSVHQDSLGGPAASELYIPTEQGRQANSLVVRTSVGPTRLAKEIRDRILEVDHTVPISDVRTMDDLYSESLQRQRMTLTLFAVFSGVGLLLSAVGVFGVVAYGVRQRTQEIGVRVALGADARSIRRLVMSEGFRYALAGVAGGIIAALMLARFMRGMVFGISPADPLSFVIIPALLLGVAALASWVPARRATKIDPMIAMRNE